VWWQFAACVALFVLAGMASFSMRVGSHRVLFWWTEVAVVLSLPMVGPMMLQALVSQDMYLDRLNGLLDLGAQSDKDALSATGLSTAGQELMNIWNDLDKGAVKPDQAYDEADKAVRRRAASADGGGM